METISLFTLFIFNKTEPYSWPVRVCKRQHGGGGGWGRCSAGRCGTEKEACLVWKDYRNIYVMG